jgi:hypothetical protein
MGVNPCGYWAFSFLVSVGICSLQIGWRLKPMYLMIFPKAERMIAYRSVGWTNNLERVTKLKIQSRTIVSQLGGTVRTKASLGTPYWPKGGFLYVTEAILLANFRPIISLPFILSPVCGG